MRGNVAAAAAAVAAGRDSYSLQSLRVSRVIAIVHCLPGVTGPDNDQDQTTTTLFGRSVVLKFQDQTMTT